MQIMIKLRAFLKDAWINFLKYIEILGFILIFAHFYGNDNILPAIALVVAFTMFPKCDMGIKPGTMFLTITGLFMLGGLCGQLYFAPLWFAAPCYFLFLVLLILVSHEPEPYKPSIPFLINFVFCQSAPASGAMLADRMLCLLVGSLFVGGWTYIAWKIRGYGKDGRGFREQIKLSFRNKSYLFRMSFGVSFAMILGTWLQLDKILWISIVVMSLTQLEYEETRERIIHRFIGTLVGVACFFLFIQILIPTKFVGAFVMFLGYIGFFFPEYKYKSIINAISAINASLVLLDTGTAVFARIGLLIAGIIIVLAIAGLAEILKKAKNRLTAKKTLTANADA